MKPIRASFDLYRLDRFTSTSQMHHGLGEGVGVDVDLIPAGGTLHSCLQQMLARIGLERITALLQSTPRKLSARLRRHQGIDELQVDLWDVCVNEVGDLAEPADSGDIGVLARYEQASHQGT